MAQLAAKLFRMCLTARLETPHADFLAAGNSAVVLSRELRDGLPGLLRVLEAEAHDPGHTDGPFSLHRMLMEAWTSRDDNRHLKMATGRTREEWLGAPLWNLAS
jgi:hypothetical protein